MPREVVSGPPGSGGRASHSLIAAVQIALRSLRRHPGLATLFVLTTLSQGTLQAVLIWALREVLLAFSKSGDAAGIGVALGAVAVFAVWLARSAGVFAAQLISARLSYRVEVEWMHRVLEKLLILSVRFFDKSSQGDVVMASYNDVKAVRAVTMQFGQLVLYLSQLGGLMVVAWLMSPKLAIVGLISVPLGAAPAYWLGQHMTQAARRERKGVVSLHDSYLQLSSGARVIKVNRGQDRIMERARKISHEVGRTVVQQLRTQGLARLLLETIAGLGLIVVLVVGGREVAAGQLQWQSLLGLLLTLMAVYSPAIGLLQLYGSMRSAVPNLDRLDQILHAVPEIQDRPHARRLLEGPSVIELRDVSFGYEGGNVLRGISAEIERGQTIGVVGPTGSGKSTLLSLLLRFYDPTDGTILYDGVDLRDIRHDDVMRYSSIVLQEPFLFVDTVTNNIRIGRPAASMDDVIAAAKAANVHDEIMEMEKGYDTVVGVGAEARQISGGQKQRICIAAALLKNAPLLFLDEATNSLDSVSEEKVQSAIERLMQHRTTFVVAHRLSTVRNADRIIVLDRGRMVGFDSHEQLLESCETYRRLWISQVGASEALRPRRAGVANA